MNHMNSRFFQVIKHAFSEHGVVLQSFFHLFRRFFLSWTWIKFRLLMLWLTPLFLARVIIFGILLMNGDLLSVVMTTLYKSPIIAPLLLQYPAIATLVAVALLIYIKIGGSIGMIIASLCVIFIIFLIFLAGYFYFFAKLLFVRVCFAYSHSQKYILELKRNIFHWDLHKALLRFIIVVSLGIVAYIVIAGCSMSLVLLGQSGDTLDVLSTFLAFTGVLILTGFWYSFAANMMRYSKRRIWTIYIVYITLVFMSFLIPALGLSEIALINIIVNGNSFILRIGEIPFIIVFSGFLFIFLALFLNYIWSMVLFARQMEKPSQTWFSVFHKSYDLALGHRKKVLWLILPFWLILIGLTSFLEYSSEKIILHRSYQVLSQELRSFNQVNNTQSGAQKEVTDQDLIGSYLIPAAFSGESTDREIDPKILAIFQHYEPNKDAINKELYEQMKLIINHKLVGTHSAKTFWGQLSFSYYGIVYFFVFLDWILLSGLLYYTVVNGYLFLKKNHVSSHIHE